jgi:D-tyrosyl-tRNA(Tyr) deacylase
VIAVIQRVSSSKVVVASEIVGEIAQGYTILLGVTCNDTQDDAKKLADKIEVLRIFADDAGKMNLSIKDIAAELLVISQFTLTGDLKKGRRPSFHLSAEAQEAKALYEHFISLMKSKGIPTQSGRFGAKMDVEIHNDGPVTFILDSTTL